MGKNSSLERELIGVQAGVKYAPNSFYSQIPSGVLAIVL
jgi:hypothetical protein